MNYRPEIDGLRAIAVLPVIFFHAGFEIFSGGFIGVDIFFLISGYLITTIILKELNANNFQLKDFYIRRIRRIIPALFLMMLICIPIFLQVMQPYDLENFGQSLVATSLMANNILLSITSDYWDPAIEFKPLLHTWSLGIEEQYYIIYPLLIIFFCGPKGKNILFILIFLIIASILTSYLFTEYDYKRLNFYSLFSRLWELGIGGILAYLIYILRLPSFGKLMDNFLSLFGFLLILFAIFFVNYEATFPNHKILPTIIGTSLVIIFATKHTLIKRLLSMKGFVAIGLISYSLYLWHQPIFALIRLISLKDPQNLLYIISLPLLFLIAFLSWKFENIFRNREIIKTRSLLIAVFCTATIICSVGLATHMKEGFGNRFHNLKKNNSSIYISTKTYLTSAKPKAQKLAENNRDLPKILVLGDSFSSDLINMLLENNVQSSYAIKGGDYNCINPEDERDNAEEVVKDAGDAHILLMAYRKFHNIVQRDCFYSFLELLDNKKVKYLLIGTKDFGYNINPIVHGNATSFVSPSREIIDLNAEFAANLGDKYFDILKLISNSEKEVPVITPSGKVISEDRYHLTPAGAAFLGKRLVESLVEDKHIQLN